MHSIGGWGSQQHATEARVCVRVAHPHPVSLRSTTLPMKGREPTKGIAL
jgi:hypothetical protein